MPADLWASAMRKGGPSRTPGDRMSGCIVTFENDEGQLLTLHAEGMPRVALRHVCDLAVKQDPSYRITCYSNPATIMSDLRGRDNANPINRERTRAPQSLEVTIASQAGLRHMVHPRLVHLSQGHRTERENRYRERSRENRS